ncbi:MAG: amidase family protein [Balneolaceae bacterium]|nr:amidase family protein [Balneolaceae bacterium]
MSRYIYKSGLELAGMIRNGQASSVDITKAHLDQIKEHNDALNAVIIHTGEEALKTAEECDREAKKGDFRGPLHGVPMTIKEQFWLKGQKSTINFNRYKDFVAPEDALVVDRLKKAGAIIMGKTNVPKKLLDYQVWGDIYPEGKNPYDLAYSPGGSSGGSAAALVAGMTPLELGGDFGGSIRIPSYYCGLFGLKPTEYTIPNHGILPRLESEKWHVFEMAVSGPLARTVGDMELVWKIIRGPHHSDRISPRIDWHDASGKKLDEYKIAWVDEWPDYEPSDEIKTVIRDFVEVLKNQGCKTENAVSGNDLHTRSLSLWMRLSGIVLSQGCSLVCKAIDEVGYETNRI